MNPSEGNFGGLSVPLPVVGNSEQCHENNRVATTDCLPEGNTTRSNKGKKKGTLEMTRLPSDFLPGNRDVICGRGRSIWKSVGNIYFRRIILDSMDEYSAAETRAEKSSILSHIVSEVRKESPNGGFVKLDAKTGQWFEVGDFLAREKVSQSFRDVLCDNYRSSNKTKRKRRLEEQEKAAEINSEIQREAIEKMRSGRTDKNLYELICEQQSATKNSARKFEFDHEKITDGVCSYKMSGENNGVQQVPPGNASSQKGLVAPISRELSAAASESIKYPNRERLQPRIADQHVNLVSAPQMPRNDGGGEKPSAKAVASDGCRVDQDANPQLPQLFLGSQDAFEEIPLAEDLANDIDNIFEVLDS